MSKKEVIETTETNIREKQNSETPISPDGMLNIHALKHESYNNLNSNSDPFAVEDKSPKEKLEEQQLKNEITNQLQNFQSFEVGDIIETKIQHMNYDRIVLFGNYKNDIIIDAKKLNKSDYDYCSYCYVNTENLKVYIKSYDNGCYWGSIDEVRKEDVKEDIEDSINNNEGEFQAYIKKHVNGGYIVDINGVEAFLPGSQAAPNKLTNFEELLGTWKNVMGETYDKDKQMYVVSHKKWLKKNWSNLINNIKVGEWINGKITGTSHFGIFVEFKDYFTGLIHISEMDDETRQNFQSYKPEDVVQFKIKEINKKGKIILTQIESENKEENSKTNNS
jgi:small subunit ribosomal protein S1